MLRDEHYDLLDQQVNPNSRSSNYGIELYEATLEVITDIVSHHQSDYQQWIA